MTARAQGLDARPHAYPATATTARKVVPTLNRGFALTWLGHNTFKLVTRGARTVLLDPWVEGNPACPRELKTFDKIDVMTISHGHGDHMGDAVTLGKKHKPTIVCNYEIHLFLQKQGRRQHVADEQGRHRRRWPVSSSPWCTPRTRAASRTADR